MVARDHHRSNTRRTALSHSRFDLITGRVDHTHHTHEGQPALNGRRLNHSGQLVDIFIRHRQHTQRATTHIEIGRVQSLTILIGQRTLLATHVNLLAAGQHLVHRALHSHQQSSRRGVAVNGCHQFALRIKRDLSLTRSFGVERIFIESPLQTQVEQSRLGWVAKCLHSITFAAQLAVIGEVGNTHQQSLGIGIDHIVSHQHIVGIDMRYGHSVLGQRTRLVRADYGRTTERLDRGQIADNRILLSQTLHTDCQHDGRNRRQTFGDRRRSQTHRRHKHRHKVVAIQHTHHKYQYADSQRCHRQILTQLIQTLLHRGFGFGHGLDHRGDLAHLRALAHSRNHTATTTIGNRTRRKSHIRSVANRSLALDGRGLLLDG